MISVDLVSTQEQKDFARRTVSALINTGKISRGYCWCGKRADAHHVDYSKPLLILWLCPYHHGAQHRNIPEVIPSDHRPVNLAYPNRVNAQTAKIEAILGGPVPRERSKL